MDATFVGALTAYLAAQPTLEVVERLDEADVCITSADRLDEHIGARSPAPAHLVVGPDDPDSMIDALEAGALGYLPQHSSLDQIAEAVHSLAGGEAVIPPLMLGSLLKHVVRRRRAERAELERISTLTDREREVFDLLAAGLDRSAIAERLFISTGTVRSHLQRVFRKLDVHSHAEAVALAARCQLIGPEEDLQQ